METKEVLGEVVISRPGVVIASEKDLPSDCKTVEEYLEKYMGIPQDLTEKNSLSN